MKGMQLWVTFGLIAVLSVGLGAVLPHPQGNEACSRKGSGDMLDAVAAVCRRILVHVVSERALCQDYRERGIYVSRGVKTHDEVEGLLKEPARYDDRWSGVLYFKGCPKRDPANAGLLVAIWGADCLDYGSFAIYGDRDMLQEVGAILEAEGFRTTRSP
jgi:hypothetical protein